MLPECNKKQYIPKVPKYYPSNNQKRAPHLPLLDKIACNKRLLALS